MTKYEKARLSIRAQMDREIEYLDSRRLNLGEKEYWNEFNLIQKKYSAQVASVDEAERTQRAIQQEKETGTEHDRPEQRYVDVMGQLKAQKLTELIAKLAECSSSSRIENLSTDDPFYLDKLDPIGTFERWWEEEVSSFPSYAEMEEFIRRVDINDQGFLVYKESQNLNDFALEHVIREGEHTSSNSDNFDITYYQNILKSSALKTARQRGKERKAEELERMKRKQPLLANSDYLKSSQKRKHSKTKLDNTISHLVDIIYTYDLDAELEVLLIEHLETVCVPCGMLKEDQYRPMLEQFLRYVEGGQERLSVVRQAIDRGWRILSNGSI